MAEDRRFKFALRMSPEAQALVKKLYEQDNCRSQTEFIEKAVRFYAGYLSTQNSSQFLTRTLASTIRGSLDDSENRIARLLFKLAVEVSVMTHVLASGLEISDEQLSRLRGRCVQEVKRTSGSISFDNAVKIQRGV